MSRIATILLDENFSNLLADVSIFANFDGEFSGINQLYTGKGGFRYLW